MRRLFLGLCSILAIALLGGCGNIKSTLGLERPPPDEFTVYSRAPLSLPPNYGLRPPEPGVDRPQNVMPRDEARTAMTGRRARNEQAQPSTGTEALLKQLNALETDPGIRAEINRETTFLAEESTTLADYILFWKDKEPAGVAVDAAKESKRIQEARALGKPINKGEVPTIERSGKGFFDLGF